MPTLYNMINQSPMLTHGDAEWLHHLVGDWHPVADLAFADLFLILRNANNLFTISAHCRPATASTVQTDDVVGEGVWEELVDAVGEVMSEGKMKRVVFDGLIHDLIPVRHLGPDPIAVLCSSSARTPDRIPNLVQQNYDSITSTLFAMISRGEFPSDTGPSSLRHGNPRVSDGFVHIDEDGVVLYASPNAVSAIHRLGIKENPSGKVLAELITDVIEDHATVDESLPVVIMGRGTWVTDVESRGVVVSLRAIPLLEDGLRAGAVLLCRDITEIRRSERQLMTKDAMIREINHRVKNNLQTVSALLRLQARRATDPGAQQSLENAQRRIYTISMVHEVLAKTGADTVDFDETLARLLRLAAGAAATGQMVSTEFEGSFGKVHAEEATSLAVVLNELVTNAVEHGLEGRDGTITVRAKRTGDDLELTVADDGVGISEGRTGSGLGTQIVQTMITSDLLGSIDWKPGPDGGTIAHVHAHLRKRKQDDM